jgi:hypothetical protein
MLAFVALLRLVSAQTAIRINPMPDRISQIGTLFFACFFGVFVVLYRANEFAPILGSALFQVYRMHAITCSAISRDQHQAIMPMPTENLRKENSVSYGLRVSMLPPVKMALLTAAWYMA